MARVKSFDGKPCKSVASVSVCVLAIVVAFAAESPAAAEPGFGFANSVASVEGSHHERHYDFRARLCQVHERGVRDASVSPAAGDFVFADGVTIAIPGDADDGVLRRSRAD